MTFEFFGLDLFTWALVAGLGFVVPLHARGEMDQLRTRLEGGDAKARIRQFDSTIRWEWGVSLALLFVWLVMDRSLAALGLLFAPTPGQWIAIGVGLLLAVVVVVLSWRSAEDEEQLDQLADQLGDLELMAARGTVERRRFVALSITAGICEEFIYRGVLMAALTVHIGLWPAAVVSSVIFGFGHAYQGPVGIVRTGVVGLVFALLTITSGSLWVSILAHVLIDVFQGRVLSRAVERRDERQAVLGKRSRRSASGQDGFVLVRAGMCGPFFDQRD